MDTRDARRPAGLFFAALLCLLLSGCLKPAPSRGVTDLKYYFLGWPDDMVLQQKVIDAFERKNPDVHIELVQINPGQFSEKMQTMIVGGIVPDLMSLDLNSYYEWIERGMLADVTDVMEGAEREQHMHFMPIVPEQVGYHGRYYGVPYNMCGVTLQLNLDIFRKGGVPIPPAAGITWDWVLQVAPKLSRRSGNPGAPGEFFLALPDMTSLLFTYGAQIFDDPDRPRKVLVDSPQAEEMCRFVRKLSATKAVISRAELMNTSNFAMETLYLRGINAARIQGLWTRPGQYGIPKTFDWDVRPFPSGPGGRSVTADGAYLAGIYPGSPHVAEAKRFLRFYLSPEGVKINCSTGDFMPLFREMLDQPGIMPPPDFPGRHYYFDTMESGRCRFPVHGPGLAELRRIIDGRLGQVTTEPDVPIPVILKTLETEIYRWLANEKQDGFYP